MGRFPRRPVLSCASRPPLADAVEAVERRLLLSAAVTAGVARTALSDRIGADLAAVYQAYRAGAATAAVATTAAASGVAQVDGGGVQVEAFANAGKAATVARGIKKLGGTGIAAGKFEVDATVPVDDLAALAKVAGLRYARQATFVTAAGSVTSQGDAASGAAAARSATGLTGAGVTVGIISDSFNTAAATTDRYATDVATGDLPAGVQILSDGTAANTDEGRAIAQVVYDSAPGASLAFATAGAGQQALASSIAALQSAGAKVIVDDVTFLDEPMFQDGVAAKAVDAAAAAGVTYVAAAGNNGEADYAAAWRSGTPLAVAAYANFAAGAPKFYGGTPFAFNVAGAASPDYQPFTLGPGQSVRLSVQWDSPYFSASGGTGSQNSVDAYVLSADGSQVVGGAVNADVGGDPVQLVTYTNNTAATATYNLMLVDEVGAVPGYVKYVDFGGQAKFAGVSDGGTVYGHANASAVANTTTGVSTPTTLTVGAANYAQTPAYGVTPPVVEPTSGEGGTPIFYSSNGIRLSAASYHQEPAVVGVDNVDDTFFGTDTDKDGSPNFVGTSAAAADVAGIAALLLQRSPTLTPAQVVSTLEGSALDVGTAGVDAQTGYGLVRANVAVGSVVGSISGTVYQDNDGSATLTAGDVGLGGQTVYLDANNNALLDAGEPSTTTAANGTYTLANLSTATADLVRVVPPAGYTATAGKQTVAVTSGATTPNANLGLFPDLYTGTTGSDNYVLQLNPANSASIQILLNGVVQYSISKTTLTTTGAALTFNPGGGNDTLTINALVGLPFTAAGVSYNGGPVASTGGNTLVLNASPGADTAVINNLNVTFDGGAITDQNVQALTLNMGAGNDTVNVQNAQPASEFLTVNTGSGTDLVVVTNALPNSGTTTVVNGGTAATDADTLTVNRGTFTFPAGVDPATVASHLTVNAGSAATVVFPAAAAGSGVTTRTLTGLTIAAGGTVSVAAPLIEGDHAILVTNTLSIAAGGKLGLADNALVVQSGSLATLTGLLATGYAGGAWTGNGISSATAAADATRTTALGVTQNNAGGSALYGPANPFDGVFAPAAAAVIVKYTYDGDANLDGLVDGSDYAPADAGYAAALTGWGNGDFNYDGKIDGSDYTLIDNAFNTQTGGL